MVFGRHQSLGEVNGDGRPGVADVVLPRLRLRQGGGLARRGGEQEDQADRDGEGYDDGKENSRDPGGDPEPSADRERPCPPLGPEVVVGGGFAASPECSQLPPPGDGDDGGYR